MKHKTYALTNGQKIIQIRDMNDEEFKVQAEAADSDLNWILYVEKDFLEKAEKKSIDGMFYLGGGAHVLGYTNVTPYTVSWISPNGNTMRISKCFTKLLNGVNSGETDALVVMLDRFAEQHIEGIQRWAIYTDLVKSSITVTARLTKHGWISQMGKVKPMWGMYYDFNF